MARRKIVIEPNAGLQETYRSLLEADWDETTLVEATDLFRETLRAAGVLLVLAENASEDNSRSKTKPYPIPEGASPSLIDFLDRLNSQNLPRPAPSKLPARQSQKKQSLALQARVVAFLLILQHEFLCTDETGFLRDLQSLLFLNCTHVLLPTLVRERMNDEMLLVENAMAYHAQTQWHDRPEHLYFLMGELAAASGDRVSLEMALENSFRLTAPSAHEYLTKAQALWMFLMDERRHGEAKSFLLRLLRQSPLEHLAEITEMLDDTYAETLASA